MNTELGTHCHLAGATGGTMFPNPLTTAFRRTPLSVTVRGNIPAPKLLERMLTSVNCSVESPIEVGSLVGAPNTAYGVYDAANSSTDYKDALVTLPAGL